MYKYQQAGNCLRSPAIDPEHRRNCLKYQNNEAMQVTLFQANLIEFS